MVRFWFICTWIYNWSFLERNGCTYVILIARLLLIPFHRFAGHPLQTVQNEYIYIYGRPWCIWTSICYKVSQNHLMICQDRAVVGIAPFVDFLRAHESLKGIVISSADVIVWQFSFFLTSLVSSVSWEKQVKHVLERNNLFKAGGEIFLLDDVTCRLTYYRNYWSNCYLFFFIFSNVS